MPHKTIQEARANLNDSIPRIPERYAAGVSKASWADKAASPQSEANYRDGVNEAISKGTRAAGIRAAGDEMWRKGAIDKGKDRIKQGLTLALGKYEQNMAPILSAMNSAADSAPPKSRDYAENIDKRLKPVVLAAKRAAGKI